MLQLLVLKEIDWKVKQKHPDPVNSTETDEVWWTKETNQGLPVLSDADTGASEYEEVIEPENSAYLQFLEEGETWKFDDIGELRGKSEEED